MSRSKKEFTLYRATPQRSGDPVYWYFRVYDAQNRRISRSTGIVDDGTERARNEAENFVHELLKTGAIIPVPPKNFDEYATAFWDWETSTYIQEALAHDPKAFGRPYVDQMASIVKNHIQPVLGTLRIEDVTTAHMDGFETKLPKKLGSLSVKHVSNCAMNPFKI